MGEKLFSNRTLSTDVERQALEPAPVPMRGTSTPSGTPNVEATEPEKHETTPLGFVLVFLRISLSLFFIIGASHLYVNVREEDGSLFDKSNFKARPDGSEILTTLAHFGAFFTFGIVFLFVTTFLDLVKDIRESEPDANEPDSALKATSHYFALLGTMFWLIGTVHLFVLYRQGKSSLGNVMWFIGSALLIVSNLIMIAVEAKLPFSSLIKNGASFCSYLSSFIGNILFLCAVALIFEEEVPNKEVGTTEKEVQTATDKEEQATTDKEDQEFTGEVIGANCFLVGAVFYLVHSLFFTLVILSQFADDQARHKVEIKAQKEEKMRAEKRDEAARARQKIEDGTDKLWISSKTGKVVHLTDNEFNASKEIWLKAPTSDKNEMLEYNKRCREIIIEENQLINNRMSWFLQFQGFLFLSASGIATKSDPIFRIILALPGIISVFSIFAAVGAAEKSMNFIETNMKTILIHSKNNRDAIPYYPISGLPQKEYRWSLRPKKCLVTLIQFAWVGIFIYSIIVILLEVEENDWRDLFIERD